MPPPRPSVSVLLPCRDAAHVLPECIESLEHQSLADVEVVAIDDGSRDGTVSLLEAWAERDGRVTVERTGRRGLVAALRLATDIAAAPLLARMDADDVADRQRLALQVQFLADRPDLSACGTGVELFPDHRVRQGYDRYARWLNGLQQPGELWRDLLVECPVAHPTLMIRASTMAGLGGYRRCPWPEDYDLVVRLHLAGMRAANLPRALLRWRVDPRRHSLTSSRYSPTAFRRCKVHFLLHGLVPADRPLVVWGAGKVGKALAREIRRQGGDVRAFVDLDPRKLGQEIHGARVLAPAEFASRRCAEHPYVLAAVGSPGAREEIRQALDDLGYTEIDDYRACA